MMKLSNEGVSEKSGYDITGVYEIWVGTGIGAGHKSIEFFHSHRSSTGKIYHDRGSAPTD